MSTVREKAAIRPQASSPPQSGDVTLVYIPLPASRKVSMLNVSVGAKTRVEPETGGSGPPGSGAPAAACASPAARRPPRRACIYTPVSTFLTVLSSIFLSSLPTQEPTLWLCCHGNGAGAGGGGGGAGASIRRRLSRRLSRLPSRWTRVSPGKAGPDDRFAHSKVKRSRNV